VDAYLAVVSKREVREYLDVPIPDEIVAKILQAGRATGSSKNSQPWRFIVLRDPERRRALAPQMRSAHNLERCALAIAVVLTNEQLRFDAGRVAQNMMVAAWGLGVGSCPNSVHPDRADAARALLDVPADAAIATVISLGYPAAGEPRPRPHADADDILGRIDRLSVDRLASDERYRP
jgi:nitroreductase